MKLLDKALLVFWLVPWALASREQLEGGIGNEPVGPIGPSRVGDTSYSAATLSLCGNPVRTESSGRNEAARLASRKVGFEA